METDQRAFLEEWCVLMGRYSKEYYSNLSTEELKREYEKLIPKEIDVLANP